MNQSSSWQLTCFVVVGGDGGLDTGLGQDILLLILCIHFKIRFKSVWLSFALFTLVQAGNSYCNKRRERDKEGSD